MVYFEREKENEIGVSEECPRDKSRLGGEKVNQNEIRIEEEGKG